MGNPGCPWVRARLPLLVGDELLGTERRRVERHLIGCPDCRARRDSCAASLSGLRAASTAAPSRADAPSLWPALALQIRESHRPAPPSPLAWLFARPGHRVGPALACGVGTLALVVGLTVSRRERIEAEVQIALGTRPLAGLARSAPPRLVTRLVQTPSSKPKPAPSREPARAVETALAENSTPRVDYDLDRGTPMPLESRESNAKQPSY